MDTQGPRFTVRELPGEEWQKLLRCPPFDQMGQVTLRAGSDRVVVIEDAATGEVKGYWFGFWAFHLEPLWLGEEVRGNGGLIRRLWAAARRMLENAKIDLAFAIISPLNPARGYAERLGFVPAPGLAYMYQAPPEELKAAMAPLLKERA